jgi:hypothetical protein
MEVSGQLHVQAALPRGKRPRYPLDRRLGGPQSWCGRCGEEKTPCRESNPGLSARSPWLYRLSCPGSLFCICNVFIFLRMQGNLLTFLPFENDSEASWVWFHPLLPISQCHFHLQFPYSTYALLLEGAVAWICKKEIVNFLLVIPTRGI